VAFQVGSLVAHLRIEQNVSFGSKQLSLRSHFTRGRDARFRRPERSRSRPSATLEAKPTAVRRTPPAVARESRLTLLDERSSGSDEVFRDDPNQQAAEFLRSTPTG